MRTNEYIGYWWLPSLPDNKIAGTIKITTENKITLELFGVLQKPNDFRNDKSHEIILGSTIDGKLITICQANCCNSKKYNIDYFLIGVHFSKLEEMKFFKALVKFHLKIQCIDFVCLLKFCLHTLKYNTKSMCDPLRNETTQKFTFKKKN